MAGSEDPAALSRFYEAAYSADADDAELFGRWRALGAVGKADHVLALCRAAAVRPTSCLEIGCGDGALLAELGRRGFARTLAGVEIAPAAAALARQREGVGSVELYDGVQLPYGSDAFDLGILSHVLEHVPEPAALLAEAARTCRAVVVEVPLERNWSARRPAKRAHGEEIGHLQLLDREAARSIVAAAGLGVVAELEDALPLRVHAFFATTPRARLGAGARWALRSALHRLAPALARRAFTLHYACLCSRPGA